MSRRSKPRVKNRAKTHVARVKATHKKRVRSKSRGLSPAPKKRKRRAARRMARSVRAA